MSSPEIIALDSADLIKVYGLILIAVALARFSRIRQEKELLMASQMRDKRGEVKAALCLGATSRQASHEIVASDFQAALIPSINAMAAMGVVFCLE